jgi:hypothetical protein
MLPLRDLNIQLQTLKDAFQEGITAGKPFEDIKKIHQQIKDLERLIQERKQQPNMPHHTS